MKKKKVITIVLNVVFALVMLAVLVLQFQPFWVVGDHSASLMDVSARQYNEFGGSLPLIEALDAKLGGFSHMDINVQVLLTVACSALAVFMAFASKNGWLKMICAVLCLGFGLWLYFAVPAFSLGVMCYVIMACEAVGVLLSIAVLIDSLKNKESK